MARSLYNEKYKIIYIDNYLAGRELDPKDLESNDLSLFEFLKSARLVEIFQSKTRSTINSAIDYLTGLLVLTHDRSMSKIEEETKCQTTAHSFSYFLTKGMWSSEKDLAIFQSSRYWIERTFEDMKGMYGLSDLQGRSWNSWHRHVVLVMVCATFISQKTMNLKDNGIAIRITGTLELFRQLNPLIKKELFEVINRINKKIKAARQSQNRRLKIAIN